MSSALPTVLTRSVQPLESVARVQAPVVNLPAVRAEDDEREAQGLPPRFAIPNPVFITPATHGTWEQLDTETRLWRLRIGSPGALSLNLGFTRFRLATGASLYVYDAKDPHNGTRAYTDRDNEEHGQLWTPVVLADAIVVELTVPTKVREEVELALTAINVGYRFFGEEQTGEKSGACNIDVVCPEGDGWRDEIQSVAVISIGGFLSCTGFMVNNTAQDAKPYFMTANHCGLNDTNDATLVVFWNFQSPNCGDQGGGSLVDSQTGSTFRSAYGSSDFTLVELDDDPDPAWNVAFAGWNRTTADPASAVAIHHPSTDEKSISFENDPLITSDYYGSISPGNGTHLRVEDWDVGTTEPGSSGSPLFDQDHRVVGQLHGGDAACGNDLPDWYGRFSTSWSGNGTPETRLSDWLDPVPTGVETLDLLAPFASGLRVTPSDDLVSSGDPGGPFTPANTSYSLENRSDFAIDYSVTADEPWVTISDPGGTLPIGGTAFVIVSVNQNASSLELGNYMATVAFTNTTDHDGDSIRRVLLQVGVPELIYSFPLDSDAGWSVEADWAFGQPLGQGGEYGGPDPDSGHTGSNVYGYNLAGDYENDMPVYGLTTTAIDCSDLISVTLKFWRWLGVEENLYDHASVQVSNDGTNWTTVWENSGTIADSAWLQQEYDISAVADGQANVTVRWIMGPTDISWRYCGWNIDDIEIWGVDVTSSPVFLSLFTVQLEADAVAIHWTTTSPGTDGEFRLSGRHDNVEWDVSFTSEGDTNFFARDENAPLDAVGEITYDLYYGDNIQGWFLLASETVQLDTPPLRTRLIGARPNPFNPTTTIHFVLAWPGHIRLAVFDLRGRLIKVLRDEQLEAGPRTAVWNGTDDAGRAVSSGTYLTRLEADGVVQEKKMALVR